MKLAHFLLEPECSELVCALTLPLPLEGREEEPDWAPLFQTTEPFTNTPLQVSASLPIERSDYGSGEVSVVSMETPTPASGDRNAGEGISGRRGGLGRNWNL